MAEIDDELVARAIRWCAEAGRHASAGEVRAALGALSWDQLLAARAVLADPPPLRPLGPAALADIARGAPPEAAAEREREGRYRREEVAEQAPAPASAPAARAARKRQAARRQPVIRRARDLAPDEPPAARARPLLEQLHEPEGRAVLEGLLRRHGPVTPRLLAELAAGWRRADGQPPEEPELQLLLRHHGLDRSFARRERETLLHALRSARGLLRRAAAALGIRPEELEALLARSGAAPQAEELRERRRAELRRRATLSERAHLVLEAREELEDLGILAELERDLAGRLPDHLRALAAGPGPLAAALCRSLSLQRPEVEQLLGRLGLSLPAAAPSAARPERTPGRERARGRPSPPSRRPRDPRRGRPATGSRRPRPL